MLALLGLAWLTVTPGGLRVAVGVAEALLPGLRIEQADGALAGPLRIGRLAYQVEDARVTAHGVDLRWQPLRLLMGELDVERLSADSVDVVTGPSRRRGPPGSLRLPLGVRLRALDVRHAVIMERAGGPVVVAIDDFHASLFSDGHRHRVEDLRCAVGTLGVAAAGELSGEAPFALKADARLVAERGGRRFAIALQARDSLEELALTAAMTGGTARLDGTARIRPFARQGQATVAATQFDPAEWSADAPHARLDVGAAFFAGAAGWHGALSVLNRDPGRLDERRLPLVALHAELNGAGGEARVPRLAARFVRGAASGSGRWADGRLEVDVQAAAVDAAAWHGKLKPTSLDGPVHAVLSAEEQRVTARLHDARFDLAVDAARHRGDIDVANASLAHRGGELSASGRVALQGKFELRGRLRNFDPAVFAAVPHGSIAAEFAARGDWRDAPNGELRFTLGRSHLAGRTIAGGGSVTLRAEQLLAADLRLRAGANRLTASGGLGRPDQALSVTLDAPQLEQIGLGGAMRGEAVLRGDIRSPGVRWRLAASRLAWPGGSRTSDLRSEGSWDPRSEEIAAALSIGALQLAKWPSIADASLRVRGRRRDHQVQLAGAVGAQTVVATADGAFGGDRAWRGTIDSLDLTGRYRLHLLAPAALEAAGDRLVLGAAQLSGGDWRLALDGLSWDARRLRSSGRVEALPLALLWPASDPGSLRIGGDWDFTLDREATGRVRLFRESGDLAVMAGAERVFLGLSEAALTGELKEHRLAMSLRARGSAAAIDAQLGATLEPGAVGWRLAREAGWHGRLRADMASIAPFGALAGPEVALDGRLHAAAELAGTPSRPQTTGEVTVDGLRVRLLDQGIELGHGRLRARLAHDVVRLERLELTSAAAPPPAGTRIPVERRPGRLVAAGQVAADGDSGEIRLEAERLLVSQTPERWIMASGSGTLRLSGGRPALSGDVGIDGAYIALAAPGRPGLSADVAVAGREESSRALPAVDVDVSIGLGSHCYLQGMGIDSRLAGRVHLDGNGSQLRAQGSVRAVDGTFTAYGQKLAIERGILNFQGLPDNPGLNVRAMRRNQAVEAGVEVTGTLEEPKVRLVSVPEVPDAEKLSWLALGRAPGAGVGAHDASVLWSAAMALRGEQAGGLEALTHELGIEDIGVSSGTLGETSRFAPAHVAGSFAAGGAAEQIATVGKRIGSNALLSYRRSLASAENVLTLTIELTRHLAVVGSVGADSAIGLVYSFTFGDRAVPER